jgi:hypothetical protein
MEIRKVYFAYFVAAAAVLADAGCATAPAKGEDSSVLKERATERWELLIALKSDKAYDYLSPGFRKTISREKYAEEMNQRGLRWEKVEYGSQECEAATCKVRLLVQYKINMNGSVGTVKSMGPLVETWIKTDGRWFFLPDTLQPVKLGTQGNS